MGKLSANASLVYVSDVSSACTDADIADVVICCFLIE